MMEERLTPSAVTILGETLQRTSKRIEAFFLTPASPRPLAVLRIGLALILIVQALLMQNDIFNLFAHDGLVQGSLAEYANHQPNTPMLAWISTFLERYGITETSCIFWVTRIYFLSLMTLLWGLLTRLSAISVFFLHWTLINSGYSSAYGADMYAHIFLFYLMLVPAAGAYSLDLFLGRTTGEPTSVARLGLRVLQIHLSLSYFTSAIEKSLNPEWWNGALIWDALNLPGYKQFDVGWFAQWPLVPMSLGWMTLIIEGGFWFFIWPKRTRIVWLILTLSMHIGTIFFLRLHIFGAIMCAILIAVFGVSPEPRAKTQKESFDAYFEY